MGGGGGRGTEEGGSGPGLKKLHLKKKSLRISWNGEICNKKKLLQTRLQTGQLTLSNINVSCRVCRHVCRCVCRCFCSQKTWKAENIGFYHSIRHINVNDIDIKVKFLFLMPPPQKKSILKNVVASEYTSYKAYIFASIWPNLMFKCLPERVERIRTLEMKDSSINLKGLNRAGGPV